MNVVDHIFATARADPNRVALLADASGRDAESIGYGPLVDRAEAHAERFRAAGLRPGDRCGLSAPAGPTFIELALGILRASGCLVPVADEHQGEAFDGFAASARLHHVVSAPADGPSLRRLAAPAPLAGGGDDEFRALRPAFLRFTSGTTSRRKGVVIGHEAVVARTAAANGALRIGPSDRVLWQLPMAHHFVVSILLYLRYGATILLPSGSLAGPVLDLARRERATVLYASPHHYRLLAKDRSEVGLDSVRLAVSTAEGLRGDIAEAFFERFRIPLVQALGIIEVGIPVMNTVSARAKPLALGRPLPGFDVWLRDSEGRPVVGPTSPDETGEICIRGPGLFDAYLEPWIPAQAILTPDGFRTGDQGWLDVDGDLHLSGRRANRICMAGMKFFGEEVEAVLDTHIGVRESRVFAAQHEHLGEIPVAEIVPEDAAAAPTRKELAAHCRVSLPGYKVPREFRIVQALPRTITGKVQRSEPGVPDSVGAPPR